MFVSLAVERALACLPMPELGGTQQLSRDEVILARIRSLCNCRMYGNAPEVVMT